MNAKAPPTQSRPFVVAIDGPAASGKGTIARRLAAHFGFAHLDTGVLYRAVGAKVLFSGADLSDAVAAAAAARSLSAADLAQPSLRTAAVGKAASHVAAVSDVRAALLDYQRAFAADPRGAVLDGRDIGSVICPDAQVKLFITASADERARRRCAELRAQGENIAFETMLADVKARDKRDSERAEAPLIQVSDAHLLDTTELDINAAVAQAVSIVERSRSA